MTIHGNVNCLEWIVYVFKFLSAVYRHVAGRSDVSHINIAKAHV